MATMATDTVTTRETRTTAKVDAGPRAYKNIGELRNAGCEGVDDVDDCNEDDDGKNDDNNDDDETDNVNNDDETDNDENDDDDEDDDGSRNDDSDGSTS